jgi:HTH-type transcriptional regulator/antitoxin MqsA
VVERLEELGPDLRVVVDDSARTKGHGRPGSPETHAAVRLIASAPGCPAFCRDLQGQEHNGRLPGNYPEGGDEVVHVGNDMGATDAALRALKEEVEGIPSPSTIRRVAQKTKTVAA